MASGSHLFSYRDDPAVPAFPDDHPIIVYDGARNRLRWFGRRQTCYLLDSGHASSFLG